jgi:hypothetical protein
MFKLRLSLLSDVKMKSKSLVLFITIIAISVVGIVVIYHFSSFVSPQAPVEGKDLFGIDEIYQTREGGREWYVDMENPFSDDLFSSSFERNITRQEDGSWRISGPAVRLNVGTPSNAEIWKNVEITGYAKVIDSFSLAAAKDTAADDDSYREGEEKDFASDLEWRARGARHNYEHPCDGTSYTGTIDIDGNVRWKKEIWHTGGYTDARAVEKVTDSIISKWIGWKVVMYNINNNNNNSTAVKLESYLDDKNNNEWRKVTDLVDDGGWYANSSDKEFYSANCDRPKDYIITNGGPIVTFRSDNTIWDFKNLSVREIDPTGL